ncbi:MAG TPA: hypothetical protein VGX69_07555 [Solirubrobacteraceae bacterium]|jgi:hypothetical protein|nr:hypothetical protein [Solirubrobacteraceae bacterium]
MRRAFVLPLVSIGLLLCSSPALASGGDANATAAYVRADYALVAAARATQRAAETALQSLLARVRGECPNLVAGSPQNEASEKLTAELIGAMRLVALAPSAKAVARYAGAVAPLRWSNASLTRAVRSYARELLAQSRLAVPDFCGELRAWKASGYATLPATTLRFDQAYYAVYVGVGLLPTHLLARSLAAAQRGLVQRTLRLENDVIEFEAQAVETWGEIMDAAGLNP